MRIDIPPSSHPITRLHVEGPFGRIEADFEKGHTHFDFDIPEGVSIDEVSVRYEFLDSRQQPVEGGILKYAIEAPPAPPAPPADPVTDDCDCEKPAEACSNCDPEDEIAIGDEE